MYSERKKLTEPSQFLNMQRTQRLQQRHPLIQLQSHRNTSESASFIYTYKSYNHVNFTHSLFLFYLMQKSFLIVPVQDVPESKFHISPCSLDSLSVFQTRPIFMEKREGLSPCLQNFGSNVTIWLALTCVEEDQSTEHCHLLLCQSQQTQIVSKVKNSRYQIATCWKTHKSMQKKKLCQMT